MTYLHASQAMRSILSLLVGLFMAFFLSGFATPVPLESGGGVVITIEDTMLRTSSDDPGDPIVLIQVYDQSTLVYQENGCDLQQCNSDLSSLASGTYTAKAETESGEQGSKVIVIP